MLPIQTSPAFIHKKSISLYTLITREDNIRSTYKDAGVDIDAAAALVEAIKPLARDTVRPGVRGGLGGFGALFDLAAAGHGNSILVATTDGVGTKLKIAIDTGLHATIGVDLVAMCVNDLVVQGAEPLFFLDYFACGRLDVEAARTIVAGIAEGCKAAGCALIGGETAEMPGMYADGDYDLAGFAVGAAERGRILTGESVAEGDVVLGLASSGLHANGYSLVRRLVAESGLRYGSAAPFMPETSLGKALLTPTRIYVKSCLAGLRSGHVRAMAHITGGGLIENLPRVIPAHLDVEIDATSWPLPGVLAWLAEAGRIAPRELARTFNCGIGMAVIVRAEDTESVSRMLAEHGEVVWPIGLVVAGKGAGGGTRVRIKGADKAWRN